MCKNIWCDIMKKRQNCPKYTSISIHMCMCAFRKKCGLGFFFFACCVWQMESGSKWHSYKATPAGDGLVTVTSVAIGTECVRTCVCVRARVCLSVSYGQQKCWHTVASVGDGANLNSLWDEPEKTGKHISLKMRKKKKDSSSCGNICWLLCQILKTFFSFSTLYPSIWHNKLFFLIRSWMTLGIRDEGAHHTCDVRCDGHNRPKHELLQ